jgi:hypothetical protein
MLLLIVSGIIRFTLAVVKLTYHLAESLESNKNSETETVKCELM